MHQAAVRTQHEQGDPVAGGDTGVTAMGKGKKQQIALRQHDAFGSSSGAGGVDQAGQRVWRYGQPRIVPRGAGVRGINVEILTSLLHQCLCERLESVLGYYQRCGGIIQDLTASGGG
jgi:hypothetical protein